MIEGNTSPEHAFFRAIIAPRCRNNYERRLKIISSPEPENWDSADFPFEIALELTNHCNLRCVMCPVPNLKRKRGFMDETVFKRVVADISKEESGFVFLPQGFGELFLHPQWFNLLALARTSDIRPIIVLSNGMLLNRQTSQRLIETVDALVVTIDGVAKKTYESIRIQGNFDTVIRNIENFIEMRGNDESPHLVLRIIRMQETEDEIGEFRNFWSGRIGRSDIIQVAQYNDWAGLVPDREVTKTQVQRSRHPCRMLWKNFSVLYDGKVSPCCYDAEGELIIGNVLDQTVRDIWSGPVAKTLRDIHLRHQFHEIPICSRCSNWL